MNHFRFTLLLLISFFSIPAFSQIDYKGFPEWSWHQQDSTEYYLYTPSKSSNYGRYPIVLFLHGCCGEDYHATLRNAVDPPVRMWHNFGANTQQVPTYIIAPKTKVGWKQHIQNLKKVMDDLVQHHNGDPQRIYITGFSMGADGTWEFLQRYPDYFAAAIPMGMNYHGDYQKIKNVPIWTHRGETDHWADTLHKDVARIRRLNGDNMDSGGNWVTGVNPRFASYKGYGHVVQWVAASTNDLTGWAYSKVKDGNKYPVIFFKAPSYKQRVKKGEVVALQIQASDVDGTVSKILIHVNGRYYSTLSKQPFVANIVASEGDALIETTAIDNKGKSSTATTMIRADIAPRFATPELPFAQQGAYYEKQLHVNGNGEIIFSLRSASSIPEGLTLNKNGLLSGIPNKQGVYSLDVEAKDEDDQLVEKKFGLEVKAKRKEEIIVSNVLNDSGSAFPVSKIRVGAITHFDRGDDEITINDAAGFDGTTYILGNNKDTSRTSLNYLSFDVDEDATVYVAYERKDHLFTSSIPVWLKEWKKVPSSQIVAQYFYYDVYAKDFPKGRITLPGADEKRNNVSNTYLVLVQKQKTPYQFAPQINTTKLARGSLYQPYEEQVTALHGAGLQRWKVLKGVLPKGFRLSEYGRISGAPETKGRFLFTIQVTDSNGNVDTKDLEIVIE